MKLGIYTITCLINSKVYVGWTNNFEKREDDHFYKLSINKHKNKPLQNTYNKYGKSNLKFEVLEECEERFLASQENYWANLLNTHDRRYGFNIRPTHPDGKTINTPEIREKIRKSNIGRVYNWSDEFKKNRVVRMKQRGWTSEEIEKRAKKKRIPVVCLSLNGEFISRYDSARHASKELGVDYKYISMNCKNKTRFAKGYIFIFEKDYNNCKSYKIEVKLKKLMHED